MVESIWILMFIIGIVLIVLIAVRHDEEDYPSFWTLALVMLDVIIWFVLAASVFELETPYEFINSNDAVVEGIHVWSSKTCVELSYFCLMLAMVMVGYSAYAFLLTFRSLYEER